MPRKPRTIKSTDTVDSFKEAIKFVSLVCSGKGPINETHIFIGGGWTAASNGILTIACPIQSELFACPQSRLLNEALSKRGQEYHFEQPPLTIQSKKFKAVIPTIDTVLLSIPAPDNPEIEINDTLCTALQTVGVVASEDGQTIVTASILFNGQSVIATDRTIIIEYWHGLNLPIGISIPKDIIKPLASISKKLTLMGCSANSITLYFEDNSWIKTQLFAEKWPDISGLLDRPSNQLPIPKDFWEGVEAVAPFCPDGVVWFGSGSVRSHAQEGAGASFEVSGIPPGPSFSVRQLMLIRPLATTIDWFTPAAVGTMLTFQGDRVRGAIAGRSS